MSASGCVFSIVRERAGSFVAAPTIRALTTAVAVESDGADENEIIDSHVGRLHGASRCIANAAEFLLANMTDGHARRFCESEISTEVLWSSSSVQLRRKLSAPERGESQAVCSPFIYCQCCIELNTLFPKVRKISFNIWDSWLLAAELSFNDVRSEKTRAQNFCHLQIKRYLNERTIQIA